MLPIKTNLLILFFFCSLNHELHAKFVDVDVGIVLDTESWNGKSILGGVKMAISDFYANNDRYKTRIVLHIRDSKGDRLQAMSSVLDLLNTVKVHAIIGPETYIGSELLGLLADKANVPIFPFSGKSLMKYPYIIQIKEAEVSMAQSIVALVEYYKWRDVILVHEDTDHGSETLLYLLESFQEKNIRLSYRSAVSTSLKNQDIVRELIKIKSFYTTVIIVDMSPSLASRFFLNAKRLGMMSKEFVWIMTQKTTEVLQYSTKFDVIESLQGALGFRSYIPASRKLHSFKKRWNKKFSKIAPVVAIWAYDTTWALAESVERVGVLRNGSRLLNEITRNKFRGMGGEFNLTERNMITNGYEIVNAVNHGEKRVGFWKLANGITSHLPVNDVVLDNGIGNEDVIWPGGQITAPKGWTLRKGTNGKKLRIGVRTGLKFNSFVNAVTDAANVTTATGLSVDVFSDCIRALPYEVPYEFVAFASGSYDKLIDKVYNKEIDGVLGDSTILANRSELVDFTATYTDLGLGTLVKIRRKDMWFFLKPLDVKLWLSFAALVIVNGFIIWAIEVMDQESKIAPSQGMGTIFWLILLTIFSAHKEKLSSNLSRFVMFVWLTVVLILITSYTATLTSLLTVEQFEIASKGGVVGFHGGSFFGGVTVNNLHFQDSKQKAYYSYGDYADALTKGGKNGGADAIVDEVPYIRMFLGKNPSDYVMLSSEPITSGFAFIFAKGSPLVNEISREISKIRGDGTLGNLEKKWYETEYPVLPRDSPVQPKTLGLERFGGLFVISGISSGLALMISLIYFIRSKMEIASIMSLVETQNLWMTIMYFFNRNVIHR